MPLPVVSVLKGGLAVTEAAAGKPGLPVAESAVGLPVTKVAAGGLPVSYAITAPPDTTAPTITGIVFTSLPGSPTGYVAAENVTLAMSFSEPVFVTPPQPTLTLNVGGIFRTAAYISGSGTSVLNYQWIVLAGSTDANGISINANSFSFNGGTVKDAAGNVMSQIHAAVPDDPAQKVAA